MSIVTGWGINTRNLQTTAVKLKMGNFIVIFFLRDAG